MQPTIETQCKNQGLRMTGQRRVILRILDSSLDHPDVEELHRRAVAVDNRIALSTVYRTMRLLVEAGIVERHEFREGRARYEATSHEHHDHLIDLTSGHVIEFQSPEIEALQAEIAQKLGYQIVGHRLQLFGVPMQTKHGREQAKPKKKSVADG